MSEDTEVKDDGKLLFRARRAARRARDWLMRPRTVRVVGPAALAFGVALVVVGLLMASSGDGGRAPVSGPEFGRGITAQPGTAYPVPPEMVDALRYLVPEKQPLADFRIVIDSLGVNAQVVELGLDPRRVPQVPNEAARVAWYKFSAKPGTGDNAVLAGHVRWGGDRGSFADLEKLEAGDVIRLEWNDGGESVYEVVSNFELDSEDPETLRVMAPTSEDLLTLITCGGTFVADIDNPLGGDFTDRVIVRAALMQPNVAALSR